jgi:MHS family proline/betaine transporter-like MFS transporter
MSGCTFLVGVLPSYAGPYSIGIGASILVVLGVLLGFGQATTRGRARPRTRRR